MVIWIPGPMDTWIEDQGPDPMGPWLGYERPMGTGLANEGPCVHGPSALDPWALGPLFSFSMSVP